VLWDGDPLFDSDPPGPPPDRRRQGRRGVDEAALPGLGRGGRHHALPVHDGQLRGVRGQRPGLAADGRRGVRPVQPRPRRPPGGDRGGVPRLAAVRGARGVRALDALLRRPGRVLPRRLPPRPGRPRGRRRRHRPRIRPPGTARPWVVVSLRAARVEPDDYPPPGSHALSAITAYAVPALAM